MSGPATPSQTASAEYEAIEAAISVTERGRWFLAEHARRNRGAETEMLLGAIARLERTVTEDRSHEAFGQLRGNLVEMADAISRTKAEIAAISAANHEQTRLTEASLALDSIVRETERRPPTSSAPPRRFRRRPGPCGSGAPTRRPATPSITMRPPSTRPARSRTSRRSAPPGSSTPCATSKTASRR